MSQKCQTYLIRLQSKQNRMENKVNTKTYIATQLRKGDRLANVKGTIERIVSLGSSRYAIHTDNGIIECSYSRKFVLFNR